MSKVQINLDTANSNIIVTIDGEDFPDVRDVYIHTYKYIEDNEIKENLCFELCAESKKLGDNLSKVVRVVNDRHSYASAAKSMPDAKKSPDGTLIAFKDMSNVSKSMANLLGQKA